MEVDGYGGGLAWRRSTLVDAMRFMRSWTAAKTADREGFMRLKTHHFVAPRTFSGEGREPLNWPWDVKALVLGVITR